MSSKKYNTTVFSVMEWAKAELEHVGRIVSIEDPDIQYSYAQSTVNGMLHLRDALFQMVNDPKYADRKTDLLKTHDSVIRAVKHLIKDFNVNLNEIKAFNTRKVLGDLSYLKGGMYCRKTRKNRK
jgi:hypothetical protein